MAEGHLFFGCRYKDNDFIYRDYLANQVDLKLLQGLHLAFSREKESKLYVQDLLAQQPELVIRLLKAEQGCLYICGTTKMGQDVQTQVKAIVGEEYFKQMQTDKRIVVELWSS